MKRFNLLILMLFILSTAIPAICQADEREVRDVEYIGEKVEVDDAAGELISTFGPPIYKDKITLKKGWTGGVEREVKLWFYQIGGEYGIPEKSYKFMLIDGIIKAIYVVE